MVYVRKCKLLVITFFSSWKPESMWNALNSAFSAGNRAVSRVDKVPFQTAYIPARRIRNRDSDNLFQLLFQKCTVNLIISHLSFYYFVYSNRISFLWGKEE